MSPARGEAASRTRRWAPVFAWAAVILVLTSWPSAGSLLDVSWGDEFAHFGVYAILGWLAAGAMLPPRSGRQLIVVGLAIAVFGALDEVHQIWIPGRFASLADWVADVLGMSLGLITSHFLRASLDARPSHST